MLLLNKYVKNILFVYSHKTQLNIVCFVTVHK